MSLLNDALRKKQGSDIGSNSFGELTPDRKNRGRSPLGGLYKLGLLLLLSAICGVTAWLLVASPFGGAKQGDFLVNQGQTRAPEVNTAISLAEKIASVQNDAVKELESATRPSEASRAVSSLANKIGAEKRVEAPEPVPAPSVTPAKRPGTLKKQRAEATVKQSLHPSPKAATPAGKTTQKAIPEPSKTSDRGASAPATKPFKAVSAPAEDTVVQSPFFRKAVSLHRQGLLDQAIPMYRAVLENHPHHRDTLFHLASIYITQEAFGKAYALLIDLKERNPTDPEVLVNLAVTDIGRRNYAKALQVLDQAEMYRGPGYEIALHRGVALSRLERLEEALESYRQAEQSGPNRVELLFNMALAHDKQQDYASALDYYRNLIDRLDGHDPRKPVVLERIKTLQTYRGMQNAAD